MFLEFFTNATKLNICSKKFLHTWKLYLLCKYLSVLSSRTSTLQVPTPPQFNNIHMFLTTVAFNCCAFWTCPIFSDFNGLNGHILHYLLSTVEINVTSHFQLELEKHRCLGTSMFSMFVRKTSIKHEHQAIIPPQSISTFQIFARNKLDWI